MNGFDSVFQDLIGKAEPVEEPGDFRRDGLLYCGKCGAAKQCRIELEGTVLTVGCMCRCQEEAFEAEQKAKEAREKYLRVMDLRVQGIQDRELLGCTFSGSRETDILRKCRAYVERWPDMRKANSGLMFWGGVGSGKSHAAACIANALIDRGVPALVTSFLKLLNAGWEKAELTGQMKHFPLLVIDDLGAERMSDYALEIVQLVVDERYKTGLPLIVTTNLKLDELRNPKNIQYARIYDRILEMCVPVHFDGPSLRQKKAQPKMALAREVFG